MPCRSVDRCQCFKGTFCLHLHGRRLSEPKDGGSTFLWNISACLSSCTVSYLGTPQISQVLFQPCISSLLILNKFLYPRIFSLLIMEACYVFVTATLILLPEGQIINMTVFISGWRMWRRSPQMTSVHIRLKTAVSCSAKNSSIRITFRGEYSK